MMEFPPPLSFPWPPPPPPPFLFPPPPPPPPSPSLAGAKAGGARIGLVKQEGEPGTSGVVGEDARFREAEAAGLQYLRRLVRGDGVAASVVEFSRWRASFSARLDVAHPRLHIGEISLKLGGCVILYEDGIPIDAHLLRDGEAIGIGDEIVFPCFWAVIGRL